MCGLGPHERLGIVVVQFEVLADGLFELSGRSMRAAADVVLRQRGEPALDLVEPRRRGRGEVNVESRVAGEPGLDRRRLVGGVVVHDEMDIHLGRNVGFDGAQELQELGRHGAYDASDR